MSQDINTVLLTHITSGSGAASKLREQLPSKGSGMIQVAKNLFDAKSDIRRLYWAQEFSRTILHIHDFGDILLLREIVAKQELRRLISYGKQKDHTAHTAYLYLLGIWFFDNVRSVRNAVKKHCNREGDEFKRWFLFQWLYASLLHDIGYAFFELSGDTVSDRVAIDDMYSWKWITELFNRPEMYNRKPTPKEFKEFRKVHNDWRMQYGEHMPSRMASCSEVPPTEILTRLDSAPWLGELVDEWKGKSVSQVLSLDPEGDELMDYAGMVARKGYVTKKPTPGSVDHAVASGLLLFQYTSYWYWLMNKLPNEQLQKKITGGHPYCIVKLKDEVLPACRAVAYHNVQSGVEGAGKILNRITLREHPILFLAILCDELQNWDRYPAGDDLFNDLKVCADGYIEGGEILLRKQKMGKASFKGKRPDKASFKVNRTDNAHIVKKVKEGLSRLENWKSIVSYKKS